MAFEELKHDFSEIDKEVSAYVEHSLEYAKLKSFKISMVLVTYFAKVVLIGVLAILTLLFLSLAASFALGEELDNLLYGFLIVGLIYLLLAFVGYVLREKLNKPILRMFSKHYFDES
ncbi:phage holin family protein [Lentiprolixibacter aurantiacus]|uniref:Phage holin family protein n=1 Tax=Lentiprolixibacter aurantiacus TaxID=2993939 RepID=A0AAE3MN19_9FLAO|nr:phage holin family protein [Lentiprolixibacter aurantiacus]MCX2720746.1 phage holin family protein [Lentiprolixibacter aurantiacus]